MTQHYSNPERESDPHALPDVETFYVHGTCAHCGDTLGYDPRQRPWQHRSHRVEEWHTDGQGWYWQSCFPDCLPDGEPNGPFDTEELAVEDARSDAGSSRQCIGCPCHRVPWNQGSDYCDDCHTDAETQRTPHDEQGEGELPPCVLSMRCYCAGHARGNPASEPCDTSEEVKS